MYQGSPLGFLVLQGTWVHVGKRGLQDHFANDFRSVHVLVSIPRFGFRRAALTSSGGVAEATGLRVLSYGVGSVVKFIRGLRAFEGFLYAVSLRGGTV